MLGRNDMCLCGSGLKYKKCCLLKISRKQDENLYFPPAFLDAPIAFGTLKKIPTHNSYQNIKRDDIAFARFNEILNDNDTKDYLPFTNEQLQKFTHYVEKLCKHDKRKFDLRIVDENQYKEMMTDARTLKFAACIYWNEVDQYVHLYKVEVFNFISERFRKLIKNYNDVTTSAFIARQIMEAITNAIANQWVITSCFNIMARSIEKQKSSEFLTWEGLEDFLMSLVILPKKFANNLKKEMPKKVNIEIPQNYRVPSYDPTNYQQMEICKYVATNILDTRFKCEDDIVASADMLNKYYKFLCKFAHPTPMLYDFGYENIKISISEKENFIKSYILQAVYHSMLLFFNLSESECFYGYHFSGLVVSKYMSDKEPIKSFVNIDSKIIENVMNKFKDVIVPTSDGDILIVKKTGAY